MNCSTCIKTNHPFNGFFHDFKNPIDCIYHNVNDENMFKNLIRKNTHIHNITTVICISNIVNQTDINLNPIGDQLQCSIKDHKPINYKIIIINENLPRKNLSIQYSDINSDKKNDLKKIKNFNFKLIIDCNYAELSFPLVNFINSLPSDNEFALKSPKFKILNCVIVEVAKEERYNNFAFLNPYFMQSPKLIAQLIGTHNFFNSAILFESCMQSADDVNSIGKQYVKFNFNEFSFCQAEKTKNTFCPIRNDYFDCNVSISKGMNFYLLILTENNFFEYFDNNLLHFIIIVKGF